MFRMPRILVLTAGLALIPAFAAGAEEGAVVTGAAETVAAPLKTGLPQYSGPVSVLVHDWS
jgi:hypothetical protein